MEIKSKKRIMEIKNKKITMPVGKYRGIEIDKLPMSYLRWVCGHSFDKSILEEARKKLEKSNKSLNAEIEISRHAIDKFSLMYLNIWKENTVNLGMHQGIGSYIAQIALTAYEKGEDVSKKRRKDDELIMKYKDIKFVFSRGGILKTLITIY